MAPTREQQLRLLEDRGSMQREAEAREVKDVGKAGGKEREKARAPLLSVRRPRRMARASATVITMPRFVVESRRSVISYMFADGVTRNILCTNAQGTRLRLQRRRELERRRSDYPLKNQVLLRVCMRSAML
jgi:hypothetical protein